MKAEGCHLQLFCTEKMNYYNRSAVAVAYRRNVNRFHTKTFEACSFQSGQSGVITEAVGLNLG